MTGPDPSPDPLVAEGRLAAALADPSSPVPERVVTPDRRRAVRRFGVYRNNVVAGLVGALSDSFPVTKRLVGEDFFHAAARAHVLEEPPASPILHRYGDGLAAFLGRLPGLSAYPFVPDVARLERAQLVAQHAADAAPMAPERLAAVPAEALASAHFRPHPAAAVVPSAFPVVSIWRANVAGDGAGPLPGAAEWALVVRPGHRVDTLALAPAAGAFAQALLAGKTLAAAAEAGAATDPAFDLAAALEALLAGGALLDLAAPD